MTNDSPPRLGIYWLHEGQVIGVACLHSQAEPGVPGLLDSSFTHVDAWARVSVQAALPLHIEYDDLPRGRVMYAPAAQTSIVYGDRLVIGRTDGENLPVANQRIRKAIMSFFGLADGQIIWRHDNHYTVGRQRIDRLLDE